MERVVFSVCLVVSMLSVVKLRVDCANIIKLPGLEPSDENEVIKDMVNKNGLDNYFYKVFASGEESLSTLEDERDGDTTDASSCENVRDVPAELRQSDAMRPTGLSDFYKKYTEAYGIPVLGSASVPDAALSRACYVLRFLLADRRDLREAYYKSFGRVAVIGRNEQLEDIPEYGFLENIPTGWTRGLGAVSAAPVSTGSEENLLCYSDERAREIDDVLLKTLAIGILNLAAVKVNPNVKDELEKVYRHAINSGWWSNTNAARSPESYFGEGVQSFFDANAYAYPADGYHNDINTRTKLRTYDTSLFVFIQKVFTCANYYLKRCNSRRNEAHQRLWENCQPSGWLF